MLRSPMSLALLAPNTVRIASSFVDCAMVNDAMPNTPMKAMMMASTVNIESARVLWDSLRYWIAKSSSIRLGENGVSVMSRFQGSARFELTLAADDSYVRMTTKGFASR